MRPNQRVYPGNALSTNGRSAAEGETASSSRLIALLWLGHRTTEQEIEQGKRSLINIGRWYFRTMEFKDGNSRDVVANHRNL